MNTKLRGFYPEPGKKVNSALLRGIYNAGENVNIETRVYKFVNRTMDEFGEKRGKFC